jgi:hypothetical protein
MNIILNIETRTTGTTGIIEFVIVSGETVLNRFARIADAIEIRERYVRDHNNGKSNRTAFIGNTVTIG